MTFKFSLVFLVGCNRFSVDGKEVFGYAPILIDSGSSSIQLTAPIFDAIQRAMQVNCSVKYEKKKN